MSGDNQARPTVIDSRSILAGVQWLESLLAKCLAGKNRQPIKSIFPDKKLIDDLVKEVIDLYN